MGGNILFSNFANITRNFMIIRREIRAIGFLTIFVPFRRKHTFSAGCFKSHPHATNTGKKINECKFVFAATVVGGTQAAQQVKDAFARRYITVLKAVNLPFSIAEPFGRGRYGKPGFLTKRRKFGH